ncbi:hypothetical protein EMWEY_00030020 [Eimeria maxima]|uniref:Uncharacterized protein n=1 Tax=Eimeria maxima TaxID=5804 RepID=U6MBE0_EIMMA|nr:hypothetical protein EMWEY_00030020 [Eimeria maxima]CDJ60373.1 hypothetical protein EMWEY_00030020 [Eimeria maxima]
MDPHSYPLLGDVVPSSDETEKLEASGSESKLTLDYSDWEAYVGRPFNIKPSYLSSVHALSVVLISLAVTYFLLRCFELTKVRNRVAPLTRVLAAGDGRPCQESGEDEELGKNEERDDFWFDGLDRSARKPPAQDDFSEGSSRMSGDMQRLPAISTVASPAGFVGTGGLASGTRGLASGVGWTTSVESTAEPLEYQTSLERNESVLQYPQPRGTLQPCSEQLECASDNGEQTRAKVQLREGETLEMWEMRKLPPFVETQLVGVFNRTIEAVTACRSLLPRLGGEQLLQLPCEVMRLLALELGALSLVRENIEPLRSELGQAIVDLGIDALQRSNALHGCQNITRHREEIRQLIALVLELKDPRPMTEYNCADKYRIKMISLLQTAPLTVGYCLGALEALQAYTHDGRSAPLPMVDNQIALLKALPPRSPASPAAAPSNATSPPQV